MPRPMSHKVWFITGASKGFEYVWTEAALVRGDRVAAAARNIGSLDALKAKYGDWLLPLSVDVGNKAAVDDNLRYLKLRFFAEKVQPGDDAAIADLRALFDSAVKSAAGSQPPTQTHVKEGWRTVCVALS